MSAYTKLRKKITDKSAVITVMGLGYVGLPIAFELCKKGFRVYGLDNNAHRIDKLKKKQSYIDDVSDEDVRRACGKGRFTATMKENVLETSDAVIVCVPTPLRKVTEPDISYINAASRTLNRYMKEGQLIIIESTTYPGTTRDVILPVLEKGGRALNRDFFLAFSPERIDPGNPKYGLTNIPKVIGGLTEEATKLGKLLYSTIIKKVVGVSSTETAEVTKLLENTFRIVNIGLINEFAMLCHKLGIDVWEVIRAAETKPFGFMPFYPGPGIGGHCIPADPMYLSWKARTVGFETHMIDMAAKTNRMVPGYVVNRVEEMLKGEGKNLRGADILVVGTAYKKDVNDLRESPSIDIIKGLEKKKANIVYHDPHIPYLDVREIKNKMKSRKLTAALVKRQDIVLVVADHTGLDYDMIAKNAPLVLDTRNVFARLGIKGENIVTI